MTNAQIDIFITALAILSAAARAQQSVPGTIVEKKGGVIVPSSKG